MAGGPQVRVAWVQTLLARADTLPEVASTAVRNALGEDRLELVESSIGLRWIDLDDHMAVLRALRSALGPVGYRRHFASAMSAALTNPSLFAKAAAAAVRWLDASPFAVVDYMPLSAKYIFRDLGTMSIEERSANGRLILHEGFPREHAGGDEWALGWVGSLDAGLAFTLGDRAGQSQVEVVEHDPARGLFRFRCRLD